MVVYFHLPGQIEAFTPLLMGPSWLGVPRFGAGVDIFFVISGFIMVATSQRLGPKTFLFRRLMRIIPLYWIATLVLVGAALLTPSLFKETRPDFFDTVKSLLFIAFHNAAQQGKILPLLVPGWTLNLEMCFYIVFTMTLFAPIRPYQIWIVGLLFLSLLVVGLNLPNTDSLLWFYTQPRIFEFWIGMLIARVFTSRFRLVPVPMAYALIVFGLLLCVTPLPTMLDNAATCMLGAALCVIGGICAERCGAMPYVAFFVLLGDASYSIYLTHIFTLGVTRTIWLWVPMGSSFAAGIGFALFSIVSVVSVALLSYRYIEKPTLRWLQNASARPQTSRTIAAG